MAFLPNRSVLDNEWFALQEFLPYVAGLTKDLHDAEIIL